jgi:hypothetical protein
MGKAIPSQNPAVVLRSHYQFVRALLAVALIAVVGLTAAVVIVANDGDEVAATSSAKPAGSIHYGGFNPASGRPESAPLPAQQLDGVADSSGGASTGGGKDYSMNSATGDTAPPPAVSRYDGGPEEGTRGPGANSN